MDSEETQDFFQDTEETDLDPGVLLEVIQNYEYLYNLSHKEYKNMDKKEAAWRDMAKILNSTVFECQRVWKNLRDRFNKEKKLKSGDPAKPIRWKYFNQMLFYNKHSKPRKTHTTTQKARSSKQVVIERPSSRTIGEESSSSAWSEYTTNTIMSPAGVFELEGESEETGTIPTTGTVTTPSTGAVTTTPSTSKKESMKKRQHDEVSEIVGVAKKIALSLEERKDKPNDPNRTFVEYVYSCLTELSPEEAKDTRAHILTFLH